MNISTGLVFENIEISKNIFRITIKGNFKGEPGQFYMLRPENSTVLLPRAISIYDRTDEEIVFLVQKVGKGTEELSKIVKGDNLQLTGPLGNGFNTELLKDKKVALVGGGIGIAPFIYVAKAIRNIAKTVDFYGGYRDYDYGLEPLKEYVDSVNISTESGNVGHKGYITEILDPSKYDLVLVCGPEIMMFKVAKLCKEANVKAYVSMENKMACGVGACLVCTCTTKDMKNKRACVDGPVFLGEEFNLDEY